MLGYDIKTEIARKIGIAAIVSGQVDAENLETVPKEYSGLTGDYVVYLERIED